MAACAFLRSCFVMRVKARHTPKFRPLSETAPDAPASNSGKNWNSSAGRRLGLEGDTGFKRKSKHPDPAAPQETDAEAAASPSLPNRTPTLKSNFTSQASFANAMRRPDNAAGLQPQEQARPGNFSARRSGGCRFPVRRVPRLTGRRNIAPTREFGGARMVARGYIDVELEKLVSLSLAMESPTYNRSIARGCDCPPAAGLEEPRQHSGSGLNLLLERGHWPDRQGTKRMARC